ncbi:MAG: L-seryl-tRNA(Sec) selenium transferase [Nitrospirota bacterium]|nr:L-seryl-tRNA(Sec) selenium transferase [Nitrospirota bacterium]
MEQKTSRQAELRRLPSVEEVLQVPALAPWIETLSRAVVTAVVRDQLASIRKAVVDGADCPDESAIHGRIAAALKQKSLSTLRPVINATGVILHTNLGRAPLSKAAIQALTEVAAGYSNLELDLSSGKRGRRAPFMEELVRHLTGAESALVVNNNAAALLLALGTLANGKEVIISRGELVQIGGGFRIPDILQQSGAKLKEVGTTNQTYASDYEKAIGPDTAMILRVHHSNFRMLGFTHQAERRDLAALAERHNILLVEDLGSGAVADTAAFGMEHEPTPADSLAAGVHLVCFSGDKILGGPQAGILAGRKTLVEQMRRHPLLRAIRVDKLQAAALQATLIDYLKGEPEKRNPVWQMLSATIDSLRLRAEELAATLKNAGIAAEATPCTSAMGGGSLPEQDMPSYGVTVTPAYPVNEEEEKLRTGETPIMARIEEDRLVLDLRTVLPGQDDTLVKALCDSLSEAPLR